MKIVFYRRNYLVGDRIPDLGEWPSRFVKHLQNYGLGSDDYLIGKAPYIWNDEYSVRRDAVGTCPSAAFEKLGSPKLVVILLPDENESFYSDVRKWADWVFFYRMSDFSRPCLDSSTLLHTQLPHEKIIVLIYHRA